MMQTAIQYLSDIASMIWGFPMIFLLVGTHLYLTILLRCPQRHIFRAIKLSITPDSASKGDVSPFAALTTALAATIGTGNIIGVGTAVALGGPGAVFWCWCTGLLGISTKYAESLLSIKYRTTTPDGRVVGGPMYVLERALGMRWLGILFALFTLFASFGLGNLVQSNAIAVITQESLDIPPLYTGIVLAALVASVLVFGLRGISRVCAFFVPVMTVGYFVGCVYILVQNAPYLGETVRVIVEGAFTPSAVGSGVFGGSILLAARYGIARGLFSNESGMGSSPILAASARTSTPTNQALIASSATFWDTVVICCMTGLVIVSSLIAYPEIAQHDGNKLTYAAFSKIPVVGSLLLSCGMVCFAFSTILGWFFYSERAFEYLGGRRFITPYRLFYSLLVVLGSVFPLELVWSFADINNALMAIPNLVALLLLSSVVVRETRKANLL